jgi:hypothetical protein
MFAYLRIILLHLFLYDEMKYHFQYFVEAGAIAVRRVRKEDLRHVAKATGATMVYLHDRTRQLSIILFFMLFVNRVKDYFTICSFYSNIWKEGKIYVV